MSNTLYFICPVEGCEFHNRTIQAEKLPIRIHLMTKHDYTQYKETVKKYGITDDVVYRSKLWFVNRLCEIGIVKEEQV